MNSFLQKVILDNTILSYIICIGSILLALLLKRLLSKYLAGLVYKAIKKTTWKEQKKMFVDLLTGPMQVFVMILVVFISFDKLNFPSALEFEIHKVTSKQIIEGIATAILIISFIWLVLRLIDFIAAIFEMKADLTTDVSDNQLVVFFKDFFKVIITLLGILLIIRFSFNKNIGPLLTGFGLIGAALALAARESLENLIASFIIFFDKPFRVGDLVKVQHVTGTVEKIGLRSTHIRTEEKSFVTVPNKQMVDSILDNLTLRTQRKALLRLELGLGTPGQTVQEVVDNIRKLMIHPNIENSSVFLLDITTNAFIVQAELFSAPIPMADFNTMRQQIYLEIIKMLDAKNVELAGMNTEIKILKD
ncbi:MAG: mechanosensitive ion channel [Gemmatimonadaceae bacterium]|nr:mechanosensitive ion channel [Chitinophagaceae bacterium]